MHTIHTNVILQIDNCYQHVIQRESRTTPERFKFYVLAEDQIKVPIFALITPSQKEFTDGRAIYPILKPAFRTDENRLGIVSLIPKESPALLTGNPVCPKGANLTLATILH